MPCAVGEWGAGNGVRPSELGTGFGHMEVEHGTGQRRDGTGLRIAVGSE